MTELISIVTAKLAKEKEFPQGNNGGIYHVEDRDHNTGDRNQYINHERFLITTQAFLQKWFREIHSIDVEAYSNASGYHWWLNKSFKKDWFSGGTHIVDSDLSGPNNAGGWDTYEEALEQGLIAALKKIT